MNRNVLQKFLMLIFLIGIHTNSFGQYKMEKLSRGLVAARSGNNNFISWRWLGTEGDNVTFNLYRNGAKVNTTPLTVCNYTDNGAAASATYYIKAVVDGIEQAPSAAVTVWGAQFLKIPVTAPAGGTTPDGVAYTYIANDASVADLDGDGEFEVILKWDPSNSKDNSNSGYTGNTYVDAYKMNGTRMWRINFGINIRSGAHYMDFMVFDFDGDGKAEMMARTADGTTDGKGVRIGTTTDYRNSGGYVLSGLEYFTVFNGETGAAMATANYWPARGTVGDWGDTYGNRVDRFRAGVAYLDGVKPSGIFCRGYYTRLAVAAWDWDGKNLTNRWKFDSGFNSSNEYFSQGDHSLSIADVDGDGKQEVISGAAIIDDNGTGYYSTQKGHGDALHVGDLDPSLPGLEVFNIQEPVGDAGAYMYSAKDKKILWKKASVAGSDEGPGRGVCADISAKWPGSEAWVIGGGVSGQLMDVKGNFVGNQPTSGGSGATCNFLVWWNGDLLREMLDDTRIDNYDLGRIVVLGSLAPVSSNNGSKKNPCLSGDIIGDWREEVLMRASDNTALYLFTTVIPTGYKFRTLLHDAQYRTAIAWQNTGYNQPPHPSFFLGDGVTSIPKPNIATVCSGITAPVVTNVSYCQGATTSALTATASTDGNLVWYGTNATGGTASYIPPIPSTSASGQTTYYVSQVISGCESSRSAIVVTVNALPSALISYTGSLTLCQGSSVTLNANSGIGLTYQWKNGSSSIGTASTYVASAAGTFTLTVTDANKCVATSTPVVTTISTVQTKWYADVDKDGKGDPNTSLTSCAQPNGYVTDNSDLCPSDSSKINPGNCGCGKTESSCLDCNNVANGSATIDDCDRCVNGATGKVPCTEAGEAETDVCLYDGTIDSNNAGFKGSGFINVPNAIGSRIVFNVNANTSGGAMLSFRYASGGANDRMASVLVNGAVQVETQSFSSTGAFTIYKTVDVSLVLNSGNNTVELVSATADGLANIDQIGYVSSGVGKGECVITAIQDINEATYVSIYPNPSSSSFHIRLNKNADVEITNLEGKVLERYKNVSELEFGSDLIPGMYFAKVENKIFKFVKY
ncbi:MAG: T9SS type A sorting domain-containing protein [Sporocytophaga sp.]|nr:T9SS type A sorting domain-containing protein [Sporocytophaga sp.]